MLETPLGYSDTIENVHKTILTRLTKDTNKKQEHNKFNVSNSGKSKQGKKLT